MCMAVRGRSTCRPGRPTAGGWRSSAIRIYGGCPDGVMPNGKPGDQPLTDITVHGLAVYSPKADALIREIVQLGGSYQRQFALPTSCTSTPKLAIAPSASCLARGQSPPGS